MSLTILFPLRNCAGQAFDRVKVVTTALGIDIHADCSLLCGEMHLITTSGSVSALGLPNWKAHKLHILTAEGKIRGDFNLLEWVHLSSFS